MHVLLSRALIEGQWFIGGHTGLEPVAERRLEKVARRPLVGQDEKFEAGCSAGKRGEPQGIDGLFGVEYDFDGAAVCSRRSRFAQA